MEKTVLQNTLHSKVTMVIIILFGVLLLGCGLMSLHIYQGTSKSQKYFGDEVISSIYYEVSDQQEVNERLNKVTNDSSYTLTKAYTELNPYKISPLSGIIIFQTKNEEQIRVYVNNKYVTTMEASKKHTIPVWGLYEDFENTAKNLHKKYPNASILMTLGSKGSIFVNSDNFVRQDIIKVKPVDTTAAGDTYTGFFLENMFNGNDVQTSMRYASIASSIAITRPGAAQSIPTKKEVLSWQGTF